MTISLLRLLRPVQVISQHQVHSALRRGRAYSKTSELELKDLIKVVEKDLKLPHSENRSNPLLIETLKSKVETLQECKHELSDLKKNFNIKEVNPKLKALSDSIKNLMANEQQEIETLLADNFNE